MRAWLFLALVIALYVVETSLLSPLSLWGVRPDLILALICVVGLHFGVQEGAVAGFLAGLFIDLAEGRFIGLGAATKAMAGGGAGWIGRTLFGGHAFVPVLGVLSASIIEHTCYLLGLWAFGVHHPFSQGFMRVILPGAWYDTSAGVLLYPFLAPLVLRYVAKDQEPGVSSVEG